MRREVFHTAAIIGDTRARSATVRDSAPPGTDSNFTTRAGLSRAPSQTATILSCYGAIRRRISRPARGSTFRCERLSHARKKNCRLAHVPLRHGSAGGVLAAQLAAVTVSAWAEKQ